MAELQTGVVTFLFSDVEGSTRLLHRLGAEYGAVQDAHMAIMREALSANGGVELRTEGDAFFVVFRTPADAVRAAVAAQRGLAGHAWPHGEPLRVRMGLHTGEGRLGGDDYLGIDVNRAARIAAAGHGGQVLISEATRVLIDRDLPDGVSLRDLGEHRLKDLPAAERVFQLDVQGLPIEFPALKSLDARPNNLPQQLTSFVGRDAEIEQVTAVLADARLVTLTGPGGTGKTRLSLEVAARSLDGFAGGVFFVDLSSVVDPSLVPSEIAKAIGMKEDPARSFVDVLEEHLRDRTVLLVLDNFEQVMEAASDLDRLLRAAPELRALVTSRSPLQVYGEREFPVPPLGLPDPSRLPDAAQLSQYEAVALFIDRATAVSPGFTVTNENAPAVAAICAGLDGLPLAIELAASRVKVLPPQAILSRLEDRLSLLRSESRTLPARQRTLRGAIDWSYDLLEEPQRRLLARFSVFAGGATFDWVEVVANPDGELGVDTLDALGSLVDKSLLRQMEDPDGEPRFSMLETIREYASERLEGSGERAELRRRHAEQVVAFAEAAEPHLEGSASWLDRCEREHDNLRAALAWSLETQETAIGLGIGAALWRFWQQRGYLREGHRLLDELLANFKAERTAVRAAAENAAGSLAYWQGDYPEAEQHYRLAFEIFRERDDRRGTMEALFNLAYIPAVARRFDEARPLFEDTLEIARELGDRRMIALASGSIAYTLLETDPAGAIEMLEEQRTVARELGNRFWETDAVGSIGQAYRSMGELDAAEQQYREAIRMYAEDGHLPMLGAIIVALGALESSRGRHERALRLEGAGRHIMAEAGTGTLPEAMMIGDLETPAREAIGDEAVGRALAEGRAMDVDQAVAYALEAGE